MFCLEPFLLKSLCRTCVQDLSSFWSFQFGGSFYSFLLRLD
uniref:Uncharacterized protein n=1 Tax=Setaria italica TaxID=4555 RepID=K3Y4B1_SETIT